MRKLLSHPKSLFTFILSILLLSSNLLSQNAPVISDIVNQTIFEGQTFSEIDLDQVVSDPDNTNSELQWSYSNNSELQVNIQDNVAVIVTPNADWFGSEEITFTVTDPDLNSASDNATFTVTGVNDAPLLADITDQTIAEGNIFAPVYLDDYVSDVDNPDNEITWTNSTTDNLTVSINDRIATVQPSANWSGAESVTFTASDPFGEQASDNVLFTVLESVPEAVNDSYSVDEGSNLSTPAPGVLSNDTDTDGDLLSAIEVSGPAHAASFSLNPDGSFSYVHDGSPAISDAFSYRAADASTQSTPAEVSITVNPVNDNPVITDIPPQTINEGGDFSTINLDDFASDEEDADNLLSWTATGYTDLNVNINSSTHVAAIEVPGKKWSGSETVTFRATDTQSGFAAKDATFTVLDVNAAPVATADAWSVNEGATLTVDAPGVLANDTDSDSDPLTAVIVTNPSYYTFFQLNNDGSFTYTHDGSETSSDAFTYRAFDGSGYSNTVTVTITVNPVNDPPVVTDIPDQTVSEGSTFATINLNNYVSDPDHSDNQMNWTYSGNSALTVSVSPTKIATITIPNINWNGSETITFTATDPLGGTSNDAATFTVTPENDPPVVSDIPNQTISEGATFATINLDNYVSDVDNNDNEMTWTYSGNSQLIVSISPSRVATVSTPNADWYGSETITFEAADPSNAKSNDAATFTVTNVNDNPVLAAIEIGALSYSEGSGPVQITASLTVTDADNSVSSATVSIASNFQNDQDVLSFVDAYGITGSYNSTSGVLTLTGTTTPANYQAALRTVKYENTSASPSTATRTISFMVNDGSANSNTQTRSVVINSTNSSPVLSDPTSVSIFFTENAGAVLLTSTVTISDDDNLTLSSAQVSITSGFQTGVDVLTFSPSGSVNGSFDNSTGVLTLTGVAFLNTYRNVLRSVRFNNTSEDPSTASRTVTFTVNDGISNSNNLNKTVVVTAVNDKPVLAAIEPGALAYQEGEGEKQVTNTITLSDVDNTTLPSSTITIVSNYQSDQDALTFTNANGITSAWNSVLGQLVLTGPASLSDFQNALRSVRYSNTSQNPSVLPRTVRFLISDGTSTSDPVSRTITVTSVNSAPVLTDPVSTPVVFTENGGPVQVTNTITVTDNDNLNLSGATVTVSSGFSTAQDALSFTAAGSITGNYSATTGILTLTGTSSVANYQTVLRSVKYNNTSEAPSETPRVISFVVNDGTVNSLALERTVTITAVNDPPVATNVTMTSINNNIGSTFTGSFTFTDPDNDNPGTHTYQWYRADNALGNLPVPINGATTVTYKPTRADGGKYISFEVTPVDEHLLAGTPVRITPFQYINAAPVASSVHVYAPTAQSGSTISGRYGYYDKEGNPRGNGIYYWYRYNVRPEDNPGLPGTQIGTDSTYRLKPTDGGKWIRFRVNPVATTGSTPGDSVWSNIIGPIGQFSATIAGTDTFCYGSVMPVNVTITGGTAPYSVVLHRAGTLPKDTTINAIPSSPRAINVKIPGTYTLKTVTDDNSDEADLSTATPVILFVNARSKALIGGTTTICPESGSHANLTLSFTAGTKPWTVTLRRKETPPYTDTTITNINSTPYTFSASILGGPTRYRVISITDANGCAGDTASGSAWLSYRTSPLARITGGDTICSGTSINLNVALTAGTAPWSFTYVRNGVNPVTVPNISTNSYTFPATQSGTYTITTVTDHVGTGCGLGKADVVYFTPPTATISGTATICDHTSTNLTVALTGKAPWKFGYDRNLTLDSIQVQNVLTSPRSVSVYKAGTYRLFEVIDINGCKGTVSGSATITLTQGPVVSITGLKTAYDFMSAEIDTIIGTPAGGEYSGPGVIGNYFIPKIAGLGSHNVSYRYRTSPSSCYGYDTVVVNVLESDAIIRFENGRNKFCKNDAPFRITGVNLDGSIGNFHISGDQGLIDNGDNTASVNPAVLGYNKYTITYTYYKTGVPFYKTADFDLGVPPVAAFNWATECYHEGQAISFINNSTSNFGFLNDTSYLWQVKTNAGFDADSNKNITYTFPQAGIYEISLKVINTYGCTDTIVQSLNLRKTYQLSNMGYYETFDNNPIEWESGKKEYPVNSWKLGTPVRSVNGFSGAFSGENCWFTNITTTTTPAPSEKSWVTSPCFDFTGMDNPMLSLEVWRLFNSNRDGANIIATSDSGKIWNLVGDIGDGINWFNSYYIRGNPGDKWFGWSNDNSTGNDSYWVNARHSLDYLKGKKEVQFRIAYGSAESAQNNDGIAFDDFAITKREKMALVEHFTNSTLKSAEEADSTLDLFTVAYGTNAINIQYHTGDPDGDPFYETNPLVPTTRQFYYGLSDVPYAVIDGGFENGFLVDFTTSKPFDKNTIIKRSLDDAWFDVRTSASRTDNHINVNVAVKSKKVLPHLELSVRIAVIESIVRGVTGENGDTLFHNVVRAMLPDASGTIISRSWDNEMDQQVEGSWEIQNVSDPNRLMVVAFVQNEATREIYNADLDTVKLSTGIDDPVIDEVKTPGYRVYPNPVRHMATVMLNSGTSHEVTLELFNNMGRLVYSGKIDPGVNSAEIPVEELPDGLYVLRLISQQKLLGINKLIISK
jgi:VCBS repeat-containing protein